MPEAAADTPTAPEAEAPVVTADEPGADALGEPGKAALHKEREAKKAALQKATAAEKQLAELAARVKEFEDRDKSDGERQAEAITTAKAAEAEAAAARDEALRELMRYRVGTSIEGFPPTLIGRLKGDTEDEMAADAKQLMKELGEPTKPRKPAPDPALGQTKGGGTSTADQFASAVSAFLK